MIRLLLGLLFVMAIAVAAPKSSPSWKAKLAEEMPLLGHRNWIVVADSAYPWQVSPGVETVETNEEFSVVLKAALKAVKGSIHVRPVIFMDSELPYVTESDAPGVNAFRAQIKKILAKQAVGSVLHEKIIAQLDESGKTFHVLLLKTKLAIPYTSVFLQLNCKYWGDGAEKRLRQRMANGK